MHTRRTFLTGLASGAAVSVLAEPSVSLASPRCGNSENSVHASYARILIGHLRKLQANPRHNIFASGELATAYRMHCDALQASGHNTAVTSGVRQKGVSPLTANDLESHYQLFSKLGVPIHSGIQSQITSVLTAASSTMAPKMEAALQTHTILKVQRSIHGAMLKAKSLQAPKSQSVANHAPSSMAKLQNATYSTGKAHLVNAGFNLSDCNDWLDAEWEGGYMTYCADDGEGGGGGGGDDGYSAAFLSSIPLPNGGSISPCALFDDIVALVAGLGGVGVVLLLEGSTVLTVIGGIAITASGLAALLAAIVVIYTFLAAVCG